MSTPAATPAPTAGADPASTQPARAGLVLGTLILVAAVANLNLSVANVALPDIGKAFDSSQTTLDLIAVGYSLGLAASVLWFGALGDRYGRKLMILIGMALSIPACLVAAYAPSDNVLFVARVVGGLSAGMAYPTTLALITALWSGPARTKAIALWSALGGAIAALGPMVSGVLLEHFWWGSVFLVTLPLAVLALVLAWKIVPAHVNETTEKVDNLGGVLSAVADRRPRGGHQLHHRPQPEDRRGGPARHRRRRPGPVRPEAAQGCQPALRPRRRQAPDVLGRGLRRDHRVRLVDGHRSSSTSSTSRTSWDTHSLQAGLAILPAVVFMVLVAPRSAALVQRNGSRATLLSGQVLLALAFVGMLLLWKDNSPYWQVAIPLCLMGAGVGLAGTPSSNSLTGSVPVTRVGMASGTADLQRDLGGAFMTSIFGACSPPATRRRWAAAIAASGQNVTSSTQSDAPALLRQRREPRQPEPEVRRPDPRRGQVVVPPGRPVGLPGRAGGSADRRRPGLLRLPRKEQEAELHSRFLEEDEPASPEHDAA